MRFWVFKFFNILLKLLGSSPLIVRVLNNILSFHSSLTVIGYEVVYKSYILIFALVICNDFMGCVVDYD